MQSQKAVNFCAPEFESVFKRVLKKESKEQYYQLRLLKKTFSSKFDETINSATVEISHLQQLGVHGLNLVDGSVKNCKRGIVFNRCVNSQIQNCVVSECANTGIEVSFSSVRYSRIYVQKKRDDSSSILVGFGGVFTEIL
eukprot:TRINITY_DN4352_c0_g1_i5.p4 TRINITY_DN4352_c0_g1~~TRINITY_DN4352_c0_g1_i5.p4  ORF type:complete len:140 (-),score=4.43 TRINITY_DN4352_c0_g1_i5:376-795(-)